MVFDYSFVRTLNSVRVQANLHFMPIWYWMRKSGLLPGQLQLLIDSTNSRDFSPGKFGTGGPPSPGKAHKVRKPAKILFGQSTPDFVLTGGRLESDINCGWSYALQRDYAGKWQRYIVMKSRKASADSGICHV